MPEDTPNPDPDLEFKRGDFARAKGEVILREHEYDGIQEFDQKLPNWWLFTFYIAIVWFVGYWVLYYHTDTYKTDQQKIVAEFTKLQEKKDAELAEAMKNLDDDALIAKAGDSAVVSAGHETYNLLCIGCHGNDLSATIAAGDTKFALPGLPLNDGQWKYGDKPLDIFHLINNGTPPESPGHNGARMEPWGQKLTPVQIAELTAFIISENPKDFGQVQ